MVSPIGKRWAFGFLNSREDFSPIAFWLHQSFTFLMNHDETGSGCQFSQVHFVPIARDRCSTANLTSSLEWLRAHDAEAKAIAKARTTMLEETCDGLKQKFENKDPMEV